MTAHATIEERQRCLAAGMNDHIAKPIDPATLFETVERYCKPPVPKASDDLDAVSGLDARAGLSRVGGNQKLYLKLLRQFVEQQSAVIAQIADAHAGGDNPLAERLAHTLKGVAGNIGATQVQFAAGALEKGIREGATEEDLDAARHRVAAVLDPLVAALRARLGAPAPERVAEPGATPMANPAESRDAAAKLNTLLADLDPAAADFIEANRVVLRPLFDGQAWPEFEKLVQGYAFTDAQAQLEQALRSFAGSV
jgi:HPt (histidine-containing phosphotransfer) domain-containing protein